VAVWLCGCVVVCGLCVGCGVVGLCGCGVVWPCGRVACVAVWRVWRVACVAVWRVWPCRRVLEGRGEASYLRVGRSQRRDRPVFRAIYVNHLTAAAIVGLCILGAAKQGRLALALALLGLLFGRHSLCRCIRQHGQ
jgi:hypothetical protein